MSSIVPIAGIMIRRVVEPRSTLDVKAKRWLARIYFFMEMASVQILISSGVITPTGGTRASR